MEQKKPELPEKNDFFSGVHNNTSEIITALSQTKSSLIYLRGPFNDFSKILQTITDNKNIDSLKLEFISEENLIILSKELAQNKSIKQLQLIYCYFTNYTCKDFGKFIIDNNYLTQLTIKGTIASNDQISDANYQLIILALTANKGLIRIVIEDSYIKTNQVVLFNDLIEKNHVITDLDLSKCYISKENLMLIHEKIASSNHFYKTLSQNQVKITKNKEALNELRKNFIIILEKKPNCFPTLVFAIAILGKNQVFELLQIETDQIEKAKLHFLFHHIDSIIEYHTINAQNKENIQVNFLKELYDVFKNSYKISIAKGIAEAIKLDQKLAIPYSPEAKFNTKIKIDFLKQEQAQVCLDIEKEFKDFISNTLNFKNNFEKYFNFFIKFEEPTNYNYRLKQYGLLPKTASKLFSALGQDCQGFEATLKLLSQLREALPSNQAIRQVIMHVLRNPGTTIDEVNVTLASLSEASTNKEKTYLEDYNTVFRIYGYKFNTTTPVYQPQAKDNKALNLIPFPS